MDAHLPTPFPPGTTSPGSGSGAGGWLVVRASGEVDLGSAGPLIDALGKALRMLPPGGELAVDLAEVTFMDCAGLAPLLMARRRLRDRFWLVNPSAKVLRLLDLAGLADEFAVFEDPATAPRDRDATRLQPSATVRRLVRQPASAGQRRRPAGWGTDTIKECP